MARQLLPTTRFSRQPILLALSWPTRTDQKSTLVVDGEHVRGSISREETEILQLPKHLDHPAQQAQQMKVPSDSERRPTGGVLGKEGPKQGTLVGFAALRPGRDILFLDPTERGRPPSNAGLHVPQVPLLLSCYNK